MSLEAVVEYIRRISVDRFPVIVALSGGVDSSLVAAAAHEALGERCIGVTVRSELTPAREFTRAAEVAEHLGLEHHPLAMRCLDNADVRRNRRDRCYHCKRRIFQLMYLEYGDNCLILDGTNSSDDPERPGLRAVAECDVQSPLRAVGMTKDQVRGVARDIGLPNWNTPSESCLATRIPQGSPLDHKTLEAIEAMESFFHARGVETLRVGIDNLVASVVFLPQYAEIMEKNREEFAALIRRIGLRSYRYKEWTGESR